MSTIPHEKLDRIIQRFATVEHDMSAGAVAGDAFVKLSKEYAELEPTARKARELRKAYDERQGLAEMVEAGGELAAMAEAERPLLAQRIATLEQEMGVASVNYSIRDLLRTTRRWTP